MEEQEARLLKKEGGEISEKEMRPRSLGSSNYLNRILSVKLHIFHPIILIAFILLYI
jgi:hypothetical protein